MAEKDQAGRLTNDSVKTLVSAALPLATMLAVVTYVLLRYSYSEFYRHFGLSPEDVGLDYARILASSIGAILLLVAIPLFALSFSLWFVPTVAPVKAEPLRPKKNIGEFARERSATHADGAFARIEERLARLTPALLTLALLAGAILGFTRHWHAVGALAGAWIYGFAVRRRQATVLGAAVAAFFLLFLAVPIYQFADLLPSFARAQAFEAGQGFRPQSYEIFGPLVLLDFTVQPATVALRDGQRGASECAMYLGTRDGVPVVYDFIRRQTVFVTPGRGIVRLRPSASIPNSCAAHRFNFLRKRLCLGVHVDKLSVRNERALCRVVQGFLEQPQLLKRPQRVSRVIKKALGPPILKKISRDDKLVTAAVDQTTQRLRQLYVKYERSLRIRNFFLKRILTRLRGSL